MDRKEEHLRLARQQHQKNLVNDFDEIRFYPQNFPKVNVSEVDLKTSWVGRNFSLPLFINAMTGGTPRAYEINQKLAILSRELNIPLALGSFSAALKDPNLISTYTVAKDIHPTGFLWTNLSADVSFEKIKQALELSKGDGLQLHLNLPQEIVMPEGDRSFSNWLENIHHTVTKLDIPVMVKETGFGMGQETLSLLKEAGVTYVDVGGKGGTSFTKIENSRRKKREFSYLHDFGLSTVESLLEGQQLKDQLFLLATGGIRNPYDVVKALALGAKNVGLAGGILPAVMEKNIDDLLEDFALWQEDLALLFTLLGAKDVATLRTAPLLFTEKILSFAKQRQLSLTSFQKTL